MAYSDGAQQESRSRETMATARIPGPLSPEHAALLVDASSYESHGYPHELWTRLRAEAPLAYFETDEYEPFWAATKQSVIRDVTSRASEFSSARGITVVPKGTPNYHSDAILMLDPPEHGPLRRAAVRRFTPRGVDERSDDIEQIVAEIFDDVAGEADEFDFVERVAAPLPIAVISWILGVPRGDWRLLFRWTNEVVGKDDAEYRRPGETPMDTVVRARGEIRAYLTDLIETRRSAPGDDLISYLFDAEVAGQPLTEHQLLDYCELLIEAGNETTRNAISGGLIAFAEHPDQWTRLRREPDLLGTAVEEVLRWSSPVIHLARVALVDVDVGGITIPAGDKVAMFYPSGNRDEDVFDDPFRFRIDRDPNPSFVFGFGEHYCMGVHVARLEISTVVRQMLARFESFEITGTVERLRANMIGGIKRLPVRASLAANR
jgi:cholest-4-en-3-one 26-monooxygenase